jgi:acyl-coenzyme A thioesterase PaaI-like protein
MAADTSSLTPLERARAFLDSLRSNQHYDHTALDGLEVVSAERGRVVCRLTPTQQHANRYGTVHGGCIGEGRRLACAQADKGAAAGFACLFGMCIRR